MRSTGARFEDLALAHLQRSGLDLVARNFTCRHGEIDLIMRDGPVVVFVEVRYRRESGFGGAVDSVGPCKRKRLIAAASLFLQARPQFARSACRFDVLAIGGEAAHADIEWLRDAFQTH
ncbi:MAG: YraN family protein [Xanthomonadales bacterium]|nr:YraN family protein [Xanthomonadales bacterium]